MQSRILPGLVLLLFAAACSAAVDADSPDTGIAETRSKTPLIIAHRGASGLYPEHTLAAYEAAIDMGADFIEPDLVITRDGHLVARHERYLSRSTNVADLPEFADRRTTKTAGGQMREDWFVEDFTLAEIKSLRARQPYEGRDTSYDDQFAIPTFTEILGLVAITNQTGQTLGVYPELKGPAELAALGFDVETAILDALAAADLASIGAPVFIQSFHPATLRSLDTKADWPLVQLLPATTSEKLTPETIAAYADGIGPWKQVVMQFSDGPEAYLEMAHEAGLVVHTYTYRDDVVAPGYETIEDELSAAFDLGVDGIFTDFPDTALAVRDGASPD